MILFINYEDDFNKFIENQNEDIYNIKAIVLSDFEMFKYKDADITFPFTLRRVYISEYFKMYNKFIKEDYKKWRLGFDCKIEFMKISSRKGTFYDNCVNYDEEIYNSRMEINSNKYIYELQKVSNKMYFTEKRLTFEKWHFDETVDDINEIFDILENLIQEAKEYPYIRKTGELSFYLNKKYTTFKMTNDKFTEYSQSYREIVLRIVNIDVNNFININIDDLKKNLCNKYINEKR